MKLSLFSPAGATLYAIIRNRADGQVWNGSTFEAWANGSIGTYDIPLTDHGGDYYTVACPTGVDWDGSLYDVAIYKQAGGSPAITDVMLTAFPMIRMEDYLTGDYFVNTSSTPWQVKLREQNTSNDLITKDAKDTSGSDITDTTTVVGRLTLGS